MSGERWIPPRSALTAAWIDSELRASAAPSVRKAERALFDEWSGAATDGLVLFGAGNLGRHTLAALRRAGLEPAAFSDNNPALHGASVEGLPVLSPQEAATRFGGNGVAVVTIWTPLGKLAYPEMADQLGRLAAWPVLPFAPLFWKYQEECLPYFLMDAPHHLYEDAEAMRRAYHLLEDEESRGECLLQLSYLLSAMDSLEVARPPVREWYFPRQLVQLSPDEVFVDCGAYDGDTIVNYLETCGGRFGKIVAFEPDPLAFGRLQQLVKELPPEARSRIELRQAAVGAKAATLGFEGGGTPGSRVAEDGSLAVDCVPLDLALQGSPPTFIKMDIEGGEEEALRGATQAIRAHRPILAICVYHLQAHLHRLPLLIHDICDDYRLFMRRLGDDGDLVCFAIPNERLIR